jgi:hypothetical protein
MEYVCMVRTGLGLSSPTSTCQSQAQLQAQLTQLPTCSSNEAPIRLDNRTSNQQWFTIRQGRLVRKVEGTDEPSNTGMIV